MLRLPIDARVKYAPVLLVNMSDGSHSTGFCVRCHLV